MFSLFKDPKMLISMLKKVDDAKILKSPYELSLNFSYGKHDKGNLPSYSPKFYRGPVVQKTINLTLG